MIKFNLGHFLKKLPRASAREPPLEAKHEIVVSTNCQTGGLTAALKCIFPNRDIGIQSFPKPDDLDAAERFRTTLRGARIWITSGRLELRGQIPMQIIKIPHLNFRAFHPDLRHVTEISTNSLIAPHNNSQIAVWAYNNQISKRDAAKLFNREVFQSLGYLDCWRDSVTALKTRFADADISSEEFERFFLRVKRMGQFMYTVNHPRIAALIELARIVARRLGADSGMVESEIVVPDALTYALWPVYPQVGEELGLRGDYHWRLGTADALVDLYGVEAYLDFVYQGFSDQGIHPAHARCLSPTPNLDEVLREQVSRL